MTIQEAYDRGQWDSIRHKSPLFRSTRHGIVAEIDDPMSDDWSDAARKAYLAGYNSE